MNKHDVRILKRGRKWMKFIAAFAILLIAGIALLFTFRFHVLIFALSSDEPRPLLEARDEGPNVTWFDDYYIVEKIAENTYAIGEPRYWQHNFNYLIVGEERAFLLDAGPGIRDIRPVVKSLTDKPLTVGFSHLHYDHVGNEITFERVALIDLPHLRAQAVNDKLTPTPLQHLGRVEGIEAPTLTVAEWLKPGSEIDLGGRSLKVLYTPGHTDGSMSLYDKENNIIFTGDVITEAILLELLPNGSMADLEYTANYIKDSTNDDIRIYSGHRLITKQGAPKQTIGDVEDVRTALQSIRERKQSAKGLAYPSIYTVNDHMVIWADYPWVQNWKRTYPDLHQ
ncbi:MBL fold metallo-hydrolase [Ruegeria sp. SCP11]|uniref:MBL fold metallo-hydrolase n=1 Tax=Ruegeria sp. SCP11 TaxID=3141378 RepID=UPI003339D392